MDEFRAVETHAPMLTLDFSRYSFRRRLLSVLLLPWYVVLFVVRGKFTTL